jgi:transposase InsO family protein
VFGISKQAYHQRIQTKQKKTMQHEQVLLEIARIRKRMPRTGTRKLYEHLQAFLLTQNIKMGRDALFTLLRHKGQLVRRTKRYHITTDSKHFFFKSPNRIKDLAITHAEQVFVSDITYLQTDQTHAYLALVTDAYSKKIMGWSLDDNMKVSMVKEALHMAHNNTVYKHTNIIHHSDRGIQYCCPDYSEFAERNGFLLSTTQQYDPYENAIAERINGILKYEFGLRHQLPNLTTAKNMVKEAVAIYNNERLHWSLSLKTPEHVHRNYNHQKMKRYGKQTA